MNFLISYFGELRKTTFLQNDKYSKHDTFCLHHQTFWEFSEIVYHSYDIHCRKIKSHSQAHLIVSVTYLKYKLIFFLGHRNNALSLTGFATNESLLKK